MLENVISRAGKELRVKKRLAAGLKKSYNCWKMLSAVGGGGGGGGDSLK